MSELKTKANDQSVADFLAGVEPAVRREDALVILHMMQEVTGDVPKMWGNSIVGFGEYHYHYESGREGNWFRMGFSPRKQNLTLYIMNGFTGVHGLLERLGKYKTGKSCLYINKLRDVDLAVLRELMEESVRYMDETYPPG